MKALNFAFILAAFGTACISNTPVNNATANGNSANASTPAVQNLTVVGRPQKITDMMAARGEQDQAKPIIKIAEPKANATVAGSTVKVKLDLSGDLKGYTPHKDPETQMGNHIHVILDNQPYEAYYDLGQEFELRNVADGEHTLRVFPSRPWHESFKNDGAFQMVKFTVKNGGAIEGRVTTKSGEPLSESGKPLSNANADRSAKPSSEGKDMQNSTAGAIDDKKPLLTYSRPKGEYKGADADAIMIDFWLTNAKLKDDRGGSGVAYKDGDFQYRVRYTVDAGEAKYIDKWEPIWLTGWTNGKHSIKLELVDIDGSVVDNGGYNSTTREIVISK